MYDNLNQLTSGFEEKAKEIGGNDAWIFKAKKGQRNENKQLLKKSDDIAGKMPDSESAKLKTRLTKIIPANAQKYIWEFDDQFLETLVELLGWGWLKERYPRYTPQFAITPDLLVKDKSDQVIAAMECKKLRTSDKDREYYENNKILARQVNDNLESLDQVRNPLLRKLIDTLAKGEQQVNKISASDKFIFLCLSFDTQFSILADEMKVCLIQKLASELLKKGILLISFEKYDVGNPITGAESP